MLCCSIWNIIYSSLTVNLLDNKKNCSDAVNPNHLLVQAEPNLENTNNMQMPVDPGVINMTRCIHIH